MVARIALTPGEVFIIVSPRGGTQEGSRQFASLDDLKEWHAGEGATFDIYRIQYMAQTESGRTFRAQVSSTPETLAATQRDPAGYMNLAAQGLDVLDGSGNIAMVDDSVQLGIMIVGYSNAVEVLVTLLEWYRPDEHGTLLCME